MPNARQEYGHLNLDDKLTPFLNAVNNYFGLSNKGDFLLLASLGLKNPECVDGMRNKHLTFTKGKEFIDGTDTYFDQAVDVLIAKYVAMVGRDNLAEVFTSKQLLDKYMSELLLIANYYGNYLIQNDFLAYKTGVTNNQANGFVLQFGNLINSLKEDTPEF